MLCVQNLAATSETKLATSLLRALWLLDEFDQLLLRDVVLNAAQHLPIARKRRNLHNIDMASRAAS